MFKINQIDENRYQFSGWYDNDKKYDLEAYREAVEDFREKIKSNQAFGTLEHNPQHEILVVSPADISHEVTDLNVEDNGMVVGQVKFMKTVSGEMVKKIANTHPEYLQIAPVGTCHVDENGVVDDLTLVRFDFVMG